jgi:hypothetical protein
MPLSNEELGAYVQTLEQLLQGNPASKAAALTPYRHKLKAFAEDADYESIERTLQILGTAVGAQSMVHNHLASTPLTVCRKVADLVPRERHPCICSPRTIGFQEQRSHSKAMSASHWQLGR